VRNDFGAAQYLPEIGLSLKACPNPSFTIHYAKFEYISAFFYYENQMHIKCGGQIPLTLMD